MRSFFNLFKRASPKPSEVSKKNLLTFKFKDGVVDLKCDTPDGLTGEFAVTSFTLLSETGILYLYQSLVKADRKEEAESLLVKYETYRRAIIGAHQLPVVSPLNVYKQKAPGS
jgi:hypothetical protein